MPRTYSPPEESLLADQYKECSYADCYWETVPDTDMRGPVGLFLGIMTPMPVWVQGLMKIRNFVVQFFGLNVEAGNGELDLEESHYGVGDYIGFFKIIHLTDDEVVVTANDRHLDASFSLVIEGSSEKRVYFTSVVKTHEKLGDVYMFFVAPVHRLIVGYMIKRLRNSTTS